MFCLSALAAFEGLRDSFQGDFRSDFRGLPSISIDLKNDGNTAWDLSVLARPQFAKNPDNLLDFNGYAIGENGTHFAAFRLNPPDNVNLVYLLFYYAVNRVATTATPNPSPLIISNVRAVASGTNFLAQNAMPGQTVTFSITLFPNSRNWCGEPLQSTPFDGYPYLGPSFRWYCAFGLGSQIQTQFVVELVRFNTFTESMMIYTREVYQRYLGPIQTIRLVDDLGGNANIENRGTVWGSYPLRSTPSLAPGVTPPNRAICGLGVSNCGTGPSEPPPPPPPFPLPEVEVL